MPAERQKQEILLQPFLSLVGAAGGEALAHSSSRRHPYEVHRNGANLPPHPQHRVLPPATVIWNKSLGWDSSRGQGEGGRRNYFI